MTYNANDVRMSIADNDILFPSATQKYPLGLEITQEPEGSSTEKAMKKYVYVKAAAALSAKDVVIIDNSGTVGAEVTTSTPATSAVPKRCGVANVDFTINYYGFLQVGGNTTITSAGATTLGNTGKLANGVKTITDEGGAAETALTIGFIKNTLGLAGDATVYLIDKRVTV